MLIPKPIGREDYDGEWVSGERDGHGKCKWENGDSYTGYWTQGKMNGQGKMTKGNGKEYHGVFCNNKFIRKND